MIASIKAEFRKLLTVRSTYILVGVAVLFVVFFAFYIEGYHLSGAELLNPHLYHEDIVGALTSLPMVFGAIIAILLMTHEYRYNTIMHTLTLSNSRSKVLASKIIVITVFALVLTAVIGALSPFMSYLGIHLHGTTLAPQEIHYGSIIWMAMFYGWAYIMVALLLATLIRNQIGAIVAIFAIPIVEQILSLLLKHNSVYLPFIALTSVLQDPEPRLGTISHGHAAAITAVYLVIGWIVAWILFIRRDAN
jgi:ABC-type transport system involved in multi-copper enzyme maturation permease subunit